MEYQKQSLAVLNQWETDIQRCKEAEDKLQEMFKQQQKMFQQQRVVQVRGERKRERESNFRPNL